MGYTNSIGSVESNQKLSLARAEAVKAYFVSKHQIEVSKIKTKGMGEISGNEELSRKVEVIIK